MKRFIVLLAVCGIMGCRGKKGDKGDPGNVLGGTSYVYTGAISSSPELVVIPNLDVSEGDQVSVYACKASGTAGVPCDQLAGNSSASTYYQALQGGLNIYGGPANGYLTYSITAVIR